MVLEVYREGRMPIRLSLPTRLFGRLLASRWLARLLLQALRDKAGGKAGQPPLDERQLSLLLGALGRGLRRYQGLALLEVQAASGERVKITL